MVWNLHPEATEKLIQGGDGSTDRRSDSLPTFHDDAGKLVGRMDGEIHRVDSKDRWSQQTEQRTFGRDSKTSSLQHRGESRPRSKLHVRPEGVVVGQELIKDPKRSVL